MRAWTVDADDIHVAEDFDESLLHRTPEIDSFLTPDRSKADSLPAGQTGRLSSYWKPSQRADQVIE
jgi:hypothetical protein